MNDVQAKDYAQSKMITLIVGKKRKEYHLHKDLLRAKSAYFEAMFSSAADWKEGEDNEVIWEDALTENGSKAVEIWVNWLYGQAMSTDHGWVVMLHCYKLGHQRVMHDFQNHVIDVCRRLHVEKRWFSNPDFLLACQDLELIDTPIYCLILESWVDTTMTRIDLLEEKYKIASAAFIKSMNCSQIAQDFAKALLNYRASPWANPHHRKGCCFHIHLEGSKCSMASA